MENMDSYKLQLIAESYGKKQNTKFGTVKTESHSKQEENLFLLFLWSPFSHPHFSGLLSPREETSLVDEVCTICHLYEKGSSCSQVTGPLSHHDP